MKIIAIGRNYIDHAKELNNPVPKEPIFFLKPDTTIIRNNHPFFYPDFSNDIQYEVEIILKISKVGKNISPRFAHRYFDEIGIGIDFTARDLQNKCKEKGLPWEMAKAFDGAAPMSKFVHLNNWGDIQNLNFRLELNGETVQQANTSQMIFPVDQLIAHVSKFLTLKIGDILFTGTPAGIGPVKIGDRLTAFIEDRKMLDFLIK
ncbi:MAG: 2-hydroxyhepta-2,4-diene-1,7-dioate isomerase [Bacteroidetes bacterium GWC2_33_15]|nr:MAG: 2-hydroxyhepta-2,4-diene-1,7-dioate isomerase [Bacteroidetes bacterium GWA2_33_15]OFX51071.1 MAG: 2-hydroxyhepta-2,4-diene-1,7-dioate isomerase [Bacteroidetes bacterium GWC2_33_15]OFX66496.1 MAG: 2-hydroxyhepta-2,4-diene-1,7-dioate isomerase [Bacteroidetes bacterium GWB2_32_14]OFX70279.1 MAG: 2-hydroxyhepta-2,4-diene-1,7-dioate isomerase [Bacteroidetes bacterium GWD2_33_33]HAN17276.1 2-hydroxyhepta-2,4-diene-1,7-dioate isomerase [Bacteroidales bacterium]